MDNHIPARPYARSDTAPTAPNSPRQMRIIDARRHIAVDGNPTLTVLVDRVPRLDELTWRVIDLGRVKPLRAPFPLLYVGIHPDGYVAPLVDLGTEAGMYGQALCLRLDDDTVRTVIGPYPASCDLVRIFAPNVGVRADVGLVDDPELFGRHRDGRGALAAGLTANAAQRALNLAISRRLAERSAPTRAFAALDWLDRRSDDGAGGVAHVRRTR